jgi:hypothetical protein
LKINFDGAYYQREKKGAWGFIVRDHRGAVVMAGAGRINVLHDALSAEAQACIATLYATIDQGISHILLETDLSILVEALQSCSYDFQLMVSYLEKLSSLCAHDLAHIGLNWDLDRSHIWIDPLLEFVTTLGVRGCSVRIADYRRVNSPF